MVHECKIILVGSPHNNVSVIGTVNRIKAVIKGESRPRRRWLTFFGDGIKVDPYSFMTARELVTNLAGN